MIYEYVSSKVVIARTLDDYAIDYTGFISRVPYWIDSALKELGSFYNTVKRQETKTITDYKCELPLNVSTVRAVTYLGYRLKRLDVINYSEDTDMDMLLHPDQGYEISNGEYIITTFSAGEVTIFYKALPVELDTVSGLYFPLIPNNEDLIAGLSNYILAKILTRGHKVREFSISANNEFLNPALYWKNHKQAIRNRLAQFDLDDRENISQMIRTFLVDFNSIAKYDVVPRGVLTELEYADFASFPTTGEFYKIYIALDTALEYVWNGTIYSEM